MKRDHYVPNRDRLPETVLLVFGALLLLGALAVAIFQGGVP